MNNYMDGRSELIWPYMRLKAFFDLIASLSVRLTFTSSHPESNKKYGRRWWWDAAANVQMSSSRSPFFSRRARKFISAIPLAIREKAGKDMKLFSSPALAHHVESNLPVQRRRRRGQMHQFLMSWIKCRRAWFSRSESGRRLRDGDMQRSKRHTTEAKLLHSVYSKLSDGERTSCRASSPSRRHGIWSRFFWEKSRLAKSSLEKKISTNKSILVKKNRICWKTLIL